ncbi:ribonuclease Z [Shewanella sp.]|uniref:ribonuclease Z n=1 Tax=Shewanella sp. TaxID=50422 RepID=UPI003A9811E2
MKLQFLGTSAGVPTKQRNVTGLALSESEGKGWYLIDCGEATQHQLLHTRLTLNTLHAIFITHVHGDHSYGLPGMLASAAMNGRKTPLKIIAPAAIQHWLTATILHTELYLPYELEFIDAASLPCVEFDQLTVTTTALSHRVPCYGYSFTETTVSTQLDTAKLQRDGIPRGPLWGQIKQGIDVEVAGSRVIAQHYLLPTSAPRKIVVAGDNDTPQLLTDTCRDTDMLVHEATYTQAVAEKVGSGPMHSYAAQIAGFAETIKLPHLVLTHFSSRYQENGPATVRDIYNEAKAAYHGQLFLARDFAEFELHKDGQLFELSNTVDK